MAGRVTISIGTTCPIDACGQIYSPAKKRASGAQEFARTERDKLSAGTARRSTSSRAPTPTRKPRPASSFSSPPASSQSRTGASRAHLVPIF